MKPDLFARTDWPSLAQQSAALVELRAVLNPHHPVTQALGGVLHFLDAVGDAARERGYTVPIDIAPLQSGLPLLTMQLPVLYCPDQEEVIDAVAYTDSTLAEAALLQLARDHDGTLDDLLNGGATCDPAAALQKLYEDGQINFSSELKHLEFHLPKTNDEPSTWS